MAIIKLASDVKLQACPFCGSQAALKTDRLDKNGIPQETIGAGFWVKCTSPKCGASPAAEMTETGVIEKWNTRPSPSQMTFRDVAPDIEVE
jgi:hypothetical protein